MSIFDRYDGTGFADALAALRGALEAREHWYLDRIEHDFQASHLWRVRLVRVAGVRPEYLSGYGTTPAVALGQVMEKLTARDPLLVDRVADLVVVEKIGG